MNSIILSAKEAQQLRDTGQVVVQDQGQEMPEGDAVAILEPWTILTRVDGTVDPWTPPRYRLQADATAEPYRFQYRPAEEMPPGAVRRYAKAERDGNGGIRLTLKREWVR